MAFETIYKLEPHRTLHLRGFDGKGAAASLVNTSATGFTMKGVFRDMADFCVLVLWDADDYFGHYQVNKYLPSFDFTGQVLTFDIAVDGLQPIDSPKFNWIDWRTLDYIKDTGEPGSIDLWSLSPTQVGGTYTAAAASWTLNEASHVAGDRVTLWYNAIAFDYTASGGETTAAIVAAIAAQINGYSGWGTELLALTASASGATLTVTSARPGLDGDMITLYELHYNSRLYWTPAGAQQLAGGSSAATWRVSIDFSALGITSLRQMWLTFAPQLANGGTYADTEWTATVTNWAVTDPSVTRALKIAGAGSTRTDSRSPAVTYSGASWVTEASNQIGGTGWFSGGFAHRMSTAGDSVTIQYVCQHSHNLFLGTSLYKDRGIVNVSLDGGAAFAFDAFLWTEPSLVTRRKLLSNVAAGTHTVTITLKSSNHSAIAGWDHASTGHYFYFDYIEAAVEGDVPDPSATYSNVCPATDWDTNHALDLSPARLTWQLDRMGFNGDLDHYVGVFWWNQRKRVGGAFSTLAVNYGGTWANGDMAQLTIGASTIGGSGGTTMNKPVFPTDTATTIAAHFAYYINQTFVGVWANASAGLLSITTRSPFYSFLFAEGHSSSGGTVAVSGNLNAGTEGMWIIDDTATPVLNAAARAWHADLYSQLVALGKTATCSFSMELVNPPDDPGSGDVWAQRFADGTPVLTDTGFASLNSTQCTFSTVVRNYQQQAFAEMATLMATAGLTPWLQCGEFLWWFFNWSPTPATIRGMALYDDDVSAAATATLGRSLATFATADDDPSVNSYADANFLRERIKAHIDGIRSYVLGIQPTAKFELLYPNDVTFRIVTLIASLGGRLNHYINLPSEYMTKAGSGLDRFKVESLAFGATERNLAWSNETVMFPVSAPRSWSRADTAYLVPWFNGGCPWPADYLAAKNESVPLIVIWAHDHGPLLSQPLPLPRNAGDAWFT